MDAIATIHAINKTETADQRISRQYIMETLCIYETEYIYLDVANLNGYELTGIFRLEHYPFTKEDHIDYVTASMLMLYLSQLGFIYTRILCEKKLLPSIINITTDEFFRLRDEGNIVFTGLDNFRLRKRIPISESQLEIKLRLKKAFLIKGYPIGDFSFETDQRVFTGNLKVAIIHC